MDNGFDRDGRPTGPSGPAASGFGPPEWRRLLARLSAARGIGAGGPPAVAHGFQAGSFDCVSARAVADRGVLTPVVNLVHWSDGKPGRGMDAAPAGTVNPGDRE